MSEWGGGTRGTVFALGRWYVFFPSHTEHLEAQDEAAVPGPHHPCVCDPGSFSETPTHMVLHGGGSIIVMRQEEETKTRKSHDGSSSPGGKWQVGCLVAGAVAAEPLMGQRCPVATDSGSSGGVPGCDVQQRHPWLCGQGCSCHSWPWAAWKVPAVSRGCRVQLCGGAGPAWHPVSAAWPCFPSALPPTAPAGSPASPGFD